MKLFGVLIAASLLSNAFVQNANAYSSADVAEALAYSGCTWGLLSDPNKFGMSQTISSQIEVGLMYRISDEGYANSDWNLTDKARTGYQNLLESWATAAALNSRWKPLEIYYEKSMVVGVKRWNSGAKLFEAKNSASAVGVPKLTALCKIVDASIKKKSLKMKLNPKQYVVRVAGTYLPTLP